MKPNRAATLLLIWWAATTAWAADASRPGPEHPPSRFEGYLYRDVEGRPLPIQSDAELEAFLAEAHIIEIWLLGSGVSAARKVVLQGDGFRAHAIFKDIDREKHEVMRTVNGRNYFFLDWRDWHGYDAAAYVLDRLLGTDRVPVAVPREVDGDRGTIGIWLENTVTANEISREMHTDPPDPQRWHQQRLMLQVYNNLVANQDCNLGNRLIDPNWRLWFIDCTRCFATTTEMFYPLERIGHCERRLWEGLKNLDVAAARGRLSPFLNKAEIKALLARRDTLVNHFQQLIDQRGEAQVLFDVAPPSGTAHWNAD